MQSSVMSLAPVIQSNVRATQSISMSDNVVLIVNVIGDIVMILMFAELLRRKFNE